MPQQQQPQAASGGGLDTLVTDPQFTSLQPADQRRALAGVSGDNDFNSLSDVDTGRYIQAHQAALKARMNPELQAAANPPRPRFGIPGLGGPQSSPLAMIGEGEQAQGEGQQRMAEEHPGALTNVAMAGLMVPYAGEGIATKGLVGWGLPFLKGALKSAAGAELGKIGGRAIGGIVSPKGAEIGGQVGGAAGGLAGPFVDNSLFAKMPLGLGRYVLSDADYAAAQAQRKLAQRAADISAGLRKPPALPAAQPQSLTDILMGKGMSSSPGAVQDMPPTRLPFLPQEGEGPLTTTGPQAQIMPKEPLPQPKSRIVEPGSTPPNVKVTYQSVPQDDLRQLVMSGDRQAISEWQRRGLQLPANVGYLVESGAGRLPWRNFKR